jgi:hypothetical protein
MYTVETGITTDMVDMVNCNIFSVAIIIDIVNENVAVIATPYIMIQESRPYIKFFFGRSASKTCIL